MKFILIKLQVFRVIYLVCNQFLLICKRSNYSYCPFKTFFFQTLQFAKYKIHLRLICVFKFLMPIVWFDIMKLDNILNALASDFHNLKGTLIKGFIGITYDFNIASEMFF